MPVRTFKPVTPGQRFKSVNTYEEVTAYYARPFPAIVAGLMLVVGLTHFKNGARVMIEDYSSGLTRKALIVGTICLSYVLMAGGLFALIRLAL